MEVVVDTWSYKTCYDLTPVKSSPPTNQHPVLSIGRIALPVPNQQCQSTEGKSCKYTIRYRKKGLKTAYKVINNHANVMHTANIPEQARQPVPEYQTSLDFAFFCCKMCPAVSIIILRRWLQLRFDCDSTEPRPFDDLRYDRRPVCVGCCTAA